jgi:hypothetical protein
MTAIGRDKLAGIVVVADVFSMSRRLGERIADTQQQFKGAR